MKIEKEEIEKHIYHTEIEKVMILEWIVEETEVEEEIEDVIAEGILEIEIEMIEEKEKTEKIAKEIHKLKIFR